MSIHSGKPRRGEFPGPGSREAARAGAARLLSLLLPGPGYTRHARREGQPSFLTRAERARGGKFLLMREFVRLGLIPFRRFLRVYEWPELGRS